MPVRDNWEREICRRIRVGIEQIIAPQSKMKSGIHTACCMQHIVCRPCAAAAAERFPDDTIFLFSLFISQIHKVLKMSQQYSNISLIKHIKRENIHHSVHSRRYAIDWRKEKWRERENKKSSLVNGWSIGRQRERKRKIENSSLGWELNVRGAARRLHFNIIMNNVLLLIFFIVLRFIEDRSHWRYFYDIVRLLTTSQSFGECIRYVLLQLPNVHVHCVCLPFLNAYRMSHLDVYTYTKCAHALMRPLAHVYIHYN